MHTADTIRSALAYIPPHDYETWVRVGMAVKSELGDAGFDLWDEWSQGCESYDERASRTKWHSIRANGGITAGTLVHEAQRHGFKFNGHSKPEPLTLEQLQERERRRKQAEAEEAAKHASAKDRAAEIWNAATPASNDHPYLVRKGRKAHGLRLYRGALVILDMPCDGSLIVPARNVEGVIQSLQFIHSEHREGDNKRFLPGGDLKGCYFPVGKLNGVLCVAEGYATGASIYEATGHAVAVAFNAGNIEAVTRGLRNKFPEEKLIICADDDYKTQGNPGLTKSREAALAVGGLLAIPGFGPDRAEGATDFDDLHKFCGAEAVDRAIRDAKSPGMSLPPDENNSTASDSEGPPSTLAKIHNEIARLAKLSPIEFDRVCKDEAKKLGCKVSTLEAEVKKARGEYKAEPGNGSEFIIAEPEPWDESVNGATLLEGLAETFRRFVVLPKHCDTIAALWTLHTYAFHLGRITPILAIYSPDKGCGKTTLRDVLAALVRSPLPTDGISAPALFRAIEKWRPTVLLDDFDSWAKDNEELRGVLNTGYRRGGVYVRCVGDDSEPRAFNTFSPKAINLIGKLSPTLHDRAVVITMRRKLCSELVDSMHNFDGEELRRKCARWVSDNAGPIESINPDLPEGLFNRTADNWRPLVVLAQVAGGDWPKLMREAINEALKNDDGDESMGTMLLADIRELFKKRNTQRIKSADLADALKEMEDRPWPEFSQAKPITVRQIARLLKLFGIKPDDNRGADGVKKGYQLEQFTEAFSRYLPQGEKLSATPLQTKQDAGFGAVQTATAAENVADRSATQNRVVADETSRRTAPVLDCSVVADEIREKAGDSNGQAEEDYVDF
jgi:putative DNA primase/helicase